LPSKPPKPAERPRMISQAVLIGSEARAALTRGLAIMASTVRPTLGPTARTVAIAPIAGTGPPEILDRAATIARRMIAIEGPFENMGAMLLRHLIWRVHETVGDGGATAAVLATRLIESAVNYIGLGGDPLALRRGIERAAAAATAELGSMARPIEFPREISSMVRKSLHDDRISLMIGEALDAVGPDGVISVRESPGMQTECEYVEGLRWNGGSVSSHLLDEERVTTTLDNPLILVTDFALTSAGDVIPVLERAFGAGRPLLIIAPEVHDAALAVLIANREHGLLAVKAPTPGDQEERAIEEIALIVGASLQRRARGDHLNNVQLSDLGSARQAWATRGMAGLLGARGDRDAIRDRLTEVRLELDWATEEDARIKLRDRIGRLSGIGVILRVGGHTKSERQERAQRIDAAISSGRAALRCGVVPGGGCALIAAARAASNQELPGDELVGARLFARALEEPLRVIAANAGVDASPVVHEAYRLTPNFVYDAVRKDWVNPWEAGILDALLVLRQVIEISVSSAVTTLRTNTLVRGPAPATSRTP
jgi:chaperonin GroEL